MHACVYYILSDGSYGWIIYYCEIISTDGVSRNRKRMNRARARGAHNTTREHPYEKLKRVRTVRGGRETLRTHARTQPVDLLVSASPNQLVNSIFLSKKPAPAPTREQAPKK